MSNNVLTLLNSSYDSFSNLYSIELIKPPVGAGLDLSGLIGAGDIRVMNFKVPSLNLGEYQTHYKTVSMPRFNAQITGDREFELRFRIDANWALYTSLKSWKDMFIRVASDEVNFGIHTSLGTNPEKYAEVKVTALKSSTLGLSKDGVKDAQEISWTFKQVILYDLVEPVFSRESSVPIEVTAKFLFGEFTPPVYTSVQTFSGAI